MTPTLLFGIDYYNFSCSLMIVNAHALSSLEFEPLLQGIKLSLKTYKQNNHF